MKKQNIILRVTDAQKAQFSSLAAEHGMSVTELIITRVLGTPVNTPSPSKLVTATNVHAVAKNLPPSKTLATELPTYRRQAGPGALLKDK